VDLVTWWMSLNRTEKNSLDLIEKLVLDSENIITQESIMWSGSSASTKSSEENPDDSSNGEDKSKNKAE